MILDEKNRILYFDKRNKEIDLTSSETKIVSFFIKNKNKRIKISEIFQFLYPQSKYSRKEFNMIKQYIYRINTKIYPYAKITAKWKTGYSLEEDLTHFYAWKEEFKKYYENT